MKTIKLAAIASSVVFALTPSIALAGQWDGTPVETKFSFNKYIEDSYIRDAIVKTGELTDNYGQTEATIKFNRPMCDPGYTLLLDMSVTLKEDGFNYTEGYSDLEYNNLVSNAELTFQFPDLKINPDTMSISTRSRCTEYAPTFGVPTGNNGDCESHWLDTDCWGY
jgi:hypothetical protein